MKSQELPHGWAWAALGDLANIVGGVTVDKKRRPNDPISVPYLRVANVQRGYIDLSEVKAIVVERTVARALRLLNGDILLNEGGDRDKLGRGWVWRGQIDSCIHQNHVFRARLRSPELNPEYVSHYANFEGASFFDREGKQTTNLASVSMSSLKKLPIRVAPAHEQARIVAKIDELFSDIEAGEKALERAGLLAKRYRQSVLKAAVTGGLTENWRAKNLARLKKEKKTGTDLLADILKTRREAWEAAEFAKLTAKGKLPKDDKWKARYLGPAAPKTDDLPDLPEGWVWATLDTVLADFGNGLSKAPADEPPGERILRISAVRAMAVDSSDTRYYRASSTSEVDGYWVRHGDLLFTRYNGSAHLVGVCGLYKGTTPVLHPDKLIKAQLLTRPRLDPRFVEIAMSTGISRAFIESRTKTSAGQHGIAGGDVKITPMPMPSLEEQSAIVQIVEEALSRADAMTEWLAAAAKQAAGLRQSILKSAFSGKLVTQDQMEEPASTLLERIQSERKGEKPAVVPAKGKAANRRRGRGRKRATNSGERQRKLL